MGTYIKKFESYMSSETCFLIDESEYDNLVDSDSENSFDIENVQNTFQSVSDRIFGKGRRSYSRVYGGGVVGLEYMDIVGGGNVRCEIREIGDYWFLGYFFYYQVEILNSYY